MTRKISFADLDDLYKSYQSGKPISQIATERGVTHKVIKRMFLQAGLSIRDIYGAYEVRRGFPLSVIPAIHSRYIAGESSVELSKELGIHSGTLRSIFRRLGLSVRSQSDAGRLIYQRRPASYRKLVTDAAHDAVRGTTHSFDEKCRHALCVEAAPHRMSGGEGSVYEALLRKNLFVIPQKAVGPYNVDFAVNGTIAVEVFGGGWHAVGRHAARHAERTRHILNSGFHVVIIWTQQRNKDIGEIASDHIVSLLKETGGDPSFIRQYRVIWSDGQILISLDSKADHFPFKPAFKMLRDARGRYYRSPN